MHDRPMRNAESIVIPGIALGASIYGLFSPPRRFRSLSKPWFMKTRRQELVALRFVVAFSLFLFVLAVTHAFA